jgi:SAM-dependent methyltransferase
MSFIKSFFKRQVFHPNWASVFVNPFYFGRKGLRDAVLKAAPHISGRIIDVGCGQKPYQSFFKFEQYIGIEVEQEGHDHTNEDVDVFYDGNHIPFADGHFDSAICSQVLEHVFHPDEFLTEIGRVLKPNGKLLLTVPFVWDEHEQPYDFARYSSFGLKHLLQKNGFEVVEHQKTLTDTRVLFQLLNGYIFKKTLWARRSPAMNLVATVIFNAWLNILGLLLFWWLPRNNDLFLDNVVVAQKK